MKRKLRGLKRSAIQLDFNLYRVDVPIRGLSDAALSVIDIWPEGVERTIVFVHGYAGCAETWEYQINHFAREYRVVVPDLRGHGQSDAPFTRYTMDELVEDLNTITETLNLPDQFILAGHSFGGSICVEYANAYPQRLEKLILIATASEYPLPRIASWAYRIPTAAFRPWWKYRPRWNAEIHVMKRMMLNNMRRWQGWPLLRNIRTPTLVITGERDTYFPRRVFEEAARMVPGAEVIDVGASKHKVQLERHQAVNRAIERFITEGRRGSWREQPDQADMLSDRPWLKSYGKDIPFTVPIPRQPLHKFLESAANWVPKRTATVFFGSKMYMAINQAPGVRAYGLSSIKACISGAAPLPVEVQEAFEKLTKGRLVEGYGLTEAAPVTHANPLLYGVRKVGSIGIPIPNTHARIVDLVTGEDLPVGKIGELLVKGPQVMQGYWGQIDEEDSESVLKNGWLCTGDVAVMDSDGYFFIISRKRDTIMAGEYSVYPRDVEEVLYENSKVMEVAVVGVEGGENGQKVKAFVVPRPGTSLSKEELLDLCRRRLEEYAVPWDIEFRHELPKSFVGKVLRRMLVEKTE